MMQKKPLGGAVSCQVIMPHYPRFYNLLPTQIKRLNNNDDLLITLDEYYRKTQVCTGLKFLNFIVIEQFTLHTILTDPAASDSNIDVI